MTIQKNFTKSLKKINILIDNLLKKNLNNLNFNNFSNIVRSKNFFLTFAVLIILFFSYLSIPNIYDKLEVRNELRNQLQNKFNLKFNFSQNLEYNFFPQPHFVIKNSIISINENEISKVKEMKIYVSLKSLFSLEKVKVNDLILKNANFNINNQTNDFFLKLLSKNFKDSNFTIKDSNIFYRNNDGEVLFINKINKMKYFYNVKELKNTVISKNEIFNLPYSLESHNNRIEKKIFSNLDISFLGFKIENEIDFSNDIVKGKAKLNINKTKSIAHYKLDKNSFIFDITNKQNYQNFSYVGKINLNPFYSNLQGDEEIIDLSYLFNPNALIVQLIKTEILNNKNLDFNLKILSNKIKNYENFKDIFLYFKIREGLLDFDNTKFSWKNNANFKILDSLMFVKDNELILDGKLYIAINDSREIYKFLLTPKNYRKEIKKIELNFNYNFDQKLLSLNDIQINNEISQNLNKKLIGLMLKDNKLQNKVYFKSIINKALKSYAG